MHAPAASSTANPIDLAICMTTMLLLIAGLFVVLRSERSRTRTVAAWAITMILVMELLSLTGTAGAEQVNPVLGTTRHVLLLVSLPLFTYAYLAERSSRQAAEQVGKTIGQLERESNELHRLSTTDALTGVGNRLAFDDALDTAWQHGLRTRTPLSLLLIDVDHFKEINDQFGHVHGDETLQQLAICLEEHAQRHSDMVARFGGDEFVILQPSTADFAARSIAAQINAAVSKLGPDLTVSIGTATMTPTVLDQPIDLVRHADTALYSAKRKGRNTIEFARTAGASTLSRDLRPYWKPTPDTTLKS